MPDWEVAAVEPLASDWQPVGQPQAKATPQKYEGDDIYRMVVDKANAYGVRPDIALSLAKQESGFSPSAVSPTGVKGLFQVTLGTGRMYKKDYNEADRRNPETSADLGLRYLADLYKEKGNWPDAIYAYNGGSDSNFRMNVGKHLPWARQQLSRISQGPKQSGGWEVESVEPMAPGSELAPAGVTAPGQPGSELATSPGQPGFMGTNLPPYPANRRIDQSKIDVVPNPFKGGQNLDAQFETKLSPEKETQFQQWFEDQHSKGAIREGDYQFYKKNGYGAGYDFRAAFEKGLKPSANGHWNDYGKKPTHETFSVESKYANEPGVKPGKWEGEKYIPWQPPDQAGLLDTAPIPEFTPRPGPEVQPRGNKGDLTGISEKGKANYQLAVNLKGQLDQTKSAFTQLDKQLKDSSSWLKANKDKVDTTSRESVTQFNTRVQAHNVLIGKAKELQAHNNEIVGQFNALHPMADKTGAIVPSGAYTIPADDPIKTVMPKYRREAGELSNLIAKGVDEAAQVLGKGIGKLGTAEQFAYGRTTPTTPEEEAESARYGTGVMRGAYQVGSMGLLQPPPVKPETGPMTGRGPTGKPYTIPSRMGNVAEAEQVFRTIGGYAAMAAPLARFTKAGIGLADLMVPEGAGLAFNKILGSALGFGAYGGAAATGETIGTGRKFDEGTISRIVDRSIDDYLLGGFLAGGHEGVAAGLRKLFAPPEIGGMPGTEFRKPPTSGAPGGESFDLNPKSIEEGIRTYEYLRQTGGITGKAVRANPFLRAAARLYDQYAGKSADEIIAGLKEEPIIKQAEKVKRRAARKQQEAPTVQPQPEVRRPPEEEPPSAAAPSPTPEPQRPPPGAPGWEVESVTPIEAKPTPELKEAPVTPGAAPEGVPPAPVTPAGVAPVIPDVATQAEAEKVAGRVKTTIPGTREEAARRRITEAERKEYDELTERGRKDRTPEENARVAELSPLVSFEDDIARRAGFGKIGPTAKPAPAPAKGKEAWEMLPGDFKKASELNKEWRSAYFNQEGDQTGSSREIPAKLSELPIGTWRIDDQLRGAYGREITQLQLIDPKDLDFQERPYEMGRGGDVQKYKQWAKDGKVPPPISVVETDDGKLRITDGHRRATAALEAGVKVPAWVSPAAELDRLDAQGEPIKVGLTYQLALKKAVDSGQELPPNVRKELQQELDEAKKSKANFKGTSHYDYVKMLEGILGERTPKPDLKPAEKGEGEVQFLDYSDANNWINKKAKEYGSRNEFLASKEYKDIYPQIKDLAESYRYEQKGKAAKAMSEANVFYGDRVNYAVPQPFGGVEVFKGTLVDRGGVPRVKLDEPAPDGRKSVMWHKGWKAIRDSQKPNRLRTKPAPTTPEEFSQQQGTAKGAKPEGLLTRNPKRHSIGKQIEYGNRGAAVRSYGGITPRSRAFQELQPEEKRYLILRGFVRKTGFGADVLLQALKHDFPGEFNTYETDDQFVRDMLDPRFNQTQTDPDQIEREAREYYERQSDSIARQAAEEGLSPEAFAQAEEDAVRERTEYERLERDAIRSEGTEPWEKELDELLPRSKVPFFLTPPVPKTPKLTKRLDALQADYPGLDQERAAVVIRALPQAEDGQIVNMASDPELFNAVAKGNLAASEIQQLLKKSSDAGQQMALPGLTPPGRLFSMAPTFYSQMAISLEAKLPGKGSGPQLADLIEGWVKKGDPKFPIKADELKWSGVIPWLREQTGSVTKQQVADFLKENQVEVNTVDKTGAPEPLEWTNYAEGYWVSKGNRYKIGRQEDGWHLLYYPEGWSERFRYLEDAKAKAETFHQENDSGTASKFQHYMKLPPGGENYREVLLTVPQTSDFKVEPDIFGDYTEVAPGEGDYKVPSAHAYGDPAADVNRFAHIFMDDRVIDGKKYLTIHELQSDWGQEGRKKGYGPQAGELPEGFTVKKFPDDYYYVVDKEGKTVPGVYGISKDVAINSYRAANQGVPPFPFSKNWMEVALKKALRMAAESSSPEWGEVTKPQNIGKQVENYLGSELASVFPLKVVDAPMLSGVQNDQIRRAVVEALPADVVNMLTSKGISTDEFTRNPRMFVDALPADSRLAVARGLADALGLVGTSLRAKLSSPSFGVGGRDEKLFATIKASDLQPSEIVGMLAPKSIYGIDGNLPYSRLGRTGAGAESPGVTAPQVKLAGVGGELSSTELATLLNRHDQLISNRVGDVNKYDAGYSGLAWATGNMVKDRYDLSKHIDSIKYTQKPNGNYDIQFYKEGTNLDRLERLNVPLSEIESLAGKDLAKKVAGNQGKEYESRTRKEIRERGKAVEVYEKTPGSWFTKYEDGSEGGTWGTKQAAEADAKRLNSMTEEKTFLLEGNALQIGGEWANRQYDQMMPQFLGKYGKQWGAKVQEGGLPDQFKVMRAGPQDWRVVGPDNKGLKDHRGEPHSFQTEQDAQKWVEYHPDQAEKLHLLPFTPALADSVLTKGQPLYKLPEEGEPNAPGQRESAADSLTEPQDRSERLAGASERLGRELEGFRSRRNQEFTEGRLPQADARIWQEVTYNPALLSSPEFQAITAAAKAIGISEVLPIKSSIITGCIFPEPDGRNLMLLSDQQLGTNTLTNVAGHETFHFRLGRRDWPAVKLFRVIDSRSPEFLRYKGHLDRTYKIRGLDPLTIPQIKDEIAANIAGGITIPGFDFTKAVIVAPDDLSAILMNYRTLETATIQAQDGDLISKFFIDAPKGKTEPPLTPQEEREGDVVLSTGINRAQFKIAKRGLDHLLQGVFNKFNDWGIRPPTAAGRRAMDKYIPSELQRQGIVNWLRFAYFPEHVARTRPAFTPMRDADIAAGDKSAELRDEIWGRMQTYFKELNPQSRAKVDALLLRLDKIQDLNARKRLEEKVQEKGADYFKGFKGHPLNDLEAKAVYGIWDAMNFVRKDLTQSMLEHLTDYGESRGLPADEARRFAGEVALNLDKPIEQVISEYLPEIKAGTKTAKGEPATEEVVIGGQKYWASEAQATDIAKKVGIEPIRIEKQAKGYVIIGPAEGGGVKAERAVSGIEKTLQKQRDTIQFWLRDRAFYLLPHTRWGPFWVRVYDQAGKMAWAGARETTAAATQMLADAKKEFGEGFKYKMTREDKKPMELYNNVNMPAVSAIMELAKDKLPADNRRELMEAWQTFWASKGWGAHMVHRSNIPGFEQENLRRVFSDYIEGYIGMRSKMTRANGFTKGWEGFTDREGGNDPALQRYTLEYTRYLLDHPYEYSWIRRLLYHMYLGGSMGFRLLHGLHAVQTAWPVLSTVTKGAGKILSKAYTDRYGLTLENLGAIEKAPGITDQEREALRIGRRHEGLSETFAQEIAAKGQSPFGRWLYNDPAGPKAKLLDIWKNIYYPGESDKWLREGMFLASLRAIDPRFSQKDKVDQASIDKALKLTQEAFFRYARGDRPPIGRGLGSVWFTFQTWSTKYFQLIHRMATEGHYGGLGRMLLAAIAVGGLTGAGILGIVKRIYRRQTGRNAEADIKDYMQGMFGETVGNITARTLMHGLPAGLFGFDLSQRMVHHLPMVEENDRPGDWGKKLIGAVGGPFEKLGYAARNLEEGNLSRTAESLAPSFIANPIRASRMYREGQTSTTGRPIMGSELEQERLTGKEAVMKGLGVQPIRLTEEEANAKFLRLMEQDQKARKQHFVSRLDNLLRAQEAAENRGDQKAADRFSQRYDQTIDELDKYNQKMLDAGRDADVITNKELNAGIKSRHKPIYQDPRGAKKQMQRKGFSILESQH